MVFVNHSCMWFALSDTWSTSTPTCSPLIKERLLYNMRQRVTLLDRNGSYPALLQWSNGIPVVIWNTSRFFLFPGNVLQCLDPINVQKYLCVPRALTLTLHFPTQCVFRMILITHSCYCGKQHKPVLFQTGNSLFRLRKQLIVYVWSEEYQATES
jgi:hypothetical protein